MIVLVTGGRAYKKRETVFTALSRVHTSTPITLLVHGGARGADQYAAQWAVANGVPVKMYAADWDKYGRPAGTRRNAIMLAEAKPDLLVAFPGGTGTADMVRRAEKAGLRIDRIEDV